MAFEGYMSFKGKTQGQSKFRPQEAGCHPVLGGHPIIGFKFGVESPRDASSVFVRKAPALAACGYARSRLVLAGAFSSLFNHVPFDTASSSSPRRVPVAASSRTTKSNSPTG